MQENAPQAAENTQTSSIKPALAPQAKSEPAERGGHFIPVSRHGLKAKLIAMVKEDGGSERAWNRAFDCLAAWRHQSYRKLLLDLAEDYLRFNPDSDAASLIELDATGETKARAE